MIRQAPTLVFDLDGTLVDTAPDLLGALNAVLVRVGHRPVDARALRHMVGHGVRVLFEHAFAETGDTVEVEQLERYTDLFVAHYRHNIARESRPFPHVPETLTRLGAAGARLGVATNKPHDLTQSLLAQLDLARHFGAMQGAGAKPYNKPDARAVLDVMTALNGAPDNTVMIGDSAVDVEAARAAGVPVVAVSYGYSNVPVAALNADAVIDDFLALPAAIHSVLDRTKVP